MPHFKDSLFYIVLSYRLLQNIIENLFTIYFTSIKIANLQYEN